MQLGCVRKNLRKYNEVLLEVANIYKYPTGSFQSSEIEPTWSGAARNNRTF